MLIDADDGDLELPTHFHPTSERLDSGRRRIQATAVEAGGDTATARADTYVLQPYRRVHESQTAGQTCRYVEWITAFPSGVDATTEQAEEYRCPEPDGERT